jgi:hypothetical protein
VIYYLSPKHGAIYRRLIGVGSGVTLFRSQGETCPNFYHLRAMASSSAEQRKASFVSSATALSTSELESAVETLQDILCERTIQSYDLDDYGTDSLVGLDKTKLKVVSLKKPG